jgi:epoxyqueuosine reductase
MPSLNLQTIKAYAASKGYIAGVCGSGSLDCRLYEQAGFVPFVSTDLHKRTKPAATAENAKSIIVIGVPHAEPKGTEPSPAELSSLGQQRDYHNYVKTIAHTLAEYLHTIDSDFKVYKTLIDSPGLDERALAVRAGLGFYGRHGLIISREYGTRFNIGCLLTNAEIETKTDSKPNTPALYTAQKLCTDCNQCAAACPTGALSANPLSANPNKNFDVRRCISYLTQKDKLTPTEEKLLGNQLYGCDICQDACPHNPPRAKTYIDPSQWLHMSDEDFQQKYGHTAILWRGAGILRRNAQIVSDNLKQPFGGGNP